MHGQRSNCCCKPYFFGRGENTEDIVDLLARELSESDRAQVRNVFSDMPSKQFFLALKVIFMNLESLSLDPVHLAIIYEVSNFRKSTPGSRFLRKILCKLNKVGSRRYIIIFSRNRKHVIFKL